MCIETDIPPLRAAGKGYLYAGTGAAFARLNFSLRWSAISAMNSEFVGLPLVVCTVYENILVSTSISPRSHAISIAWRIARSTLEDVV